MLSPTNTDLLVHRKNLTVSVQFVNMKRDLKTLLAILILALFSSRPLEAYIDPGTGSFARQIVIALILGALFTIKGFWKKIVGFLNAAISKKAKHRGILAWTNLRTAP